MVIPCGRAAGDYCPDRGGNIRGKKGIFVLNTIISRGYYGQKRTDYQADDFGRGF